MPVLDTPNGALTSTGAILRYLSMVAGQHFSAFDSAQLDQWLCCAFQEFAPVTAFLLNQVYGKQGYNPGMTQKAQGDLRQLLTMLNEHLKLRTVLAGVKLSLADFALAAQLEKYFQFFMDEKFRNSFVHVTRWMLFVSGQEEWKRAFGKLRLCDKAWSFDGYKKDEKKDEKKDDKKAEKKPEKKVEKKVEKKEEKKPEKKEEKPAAAVVGKDKNPLDLLPPTNLNFFDFKTMIVNAKDKKEAVNWLFNNFDHEGFSFWKFKYDKLEGECEKVYMTRNMSNGFLQRLEHFRKYCFGAFGIYGDEPNLDIKGIFVWRGLEKTQEIKDHPQTEYYFIEKLDSKDPKTKQLVMDYWTHLEEGQMVDGQKVQDVAYFK